MGIQQIPTISSQSEIKWTTLASSGSLSGSSGWTNSNLSGYSKYKVVWKNFKPATNYHYITMQLNSDTGSNYIVNCFGRPSGTSNYNMSGSQAYFFLNTLGLSSASFSHNGYIEIENANSTDGHKFFKGETTTVDNYGSGDTKVWGFGSYLSNSAITSIKFYTDGSTFTSDGVFLYGGV